MAELTQETITTVKSTYPVLKEHGVAITTRLYERLFAEHPDVAQMFAAAAPGQPERLANAVLAYCQNIDRLDALGPTVERIAAKHVGAGVEPAQYAIVGDILLGSMVEVLGGLDTAIIDAWSQAYSFLADVFINAEAELGQRLAAQVPGTPAT